MKHAQKSLLVYKNKDWVKMNISNLLDVTICRPGDEGNHYIVLVFALSKWPEVIRPIKITTLKLQSMHCPASFLHGLRSL